MAVKEIKPRKTYTKSAGKTKKIKGVDAKFSLNIFDENNIEYNLLPYSVVGLVVDSNDSVTSVSALDLCDSIKDLSKKGSVTISQYCDISIINTDCDVKVQHTFMSQLASNYPTYNHFGLQWTTDDITILDNIIAGKDCKFYTVDTNNFIEYFPRSLFYTMNSDGETYNTSAYQKVIHFYSTAGGSLGANTIWTAGTYYLTNNLTLGSYNLTLDATSGSIYIKTAGNYCIYQNGTGVFTTLNTSPTNKIYFTSKNDNSKGDAVSGSTGTPATGDQTSTYFNCHGTANFTLNYFEMWYQGGANGPLYFDNVSSSVIFKVTNGIFKYNTTTNSTTLYAFIGSTAASVFGSALIDNIIIDSTNQLIGTKVVGLWVNTSVNVGATVISNVFMNFGGGGGAAGIRLDGSWATSNWCYVKNVIINWNGSAGSAAFQVNYNNHTITCVLNNSVITCNNTVSGVGIKTSTAGGVALTVNNCIIYNCTGSAAYGINQGASTTITEDYNDFYNNSTNSNISLGAHSITSNPSLTNLAGGTLSAGFSLPDGYAIVPGGALDKAGSDTFANLSYNNYIYSPTGYKYNSTDKVSIGIMYIMGVFGLKGWYNASWNYRRAIIIDRTKVSYTGSFPMLVSLSGLSNINTSGTDVRFTDIDGQTELPREIESYSGGSLVAWVKTTLTRINTDAYNDTIYMYYGNAAATEPDISATYGSQNVWSPNYVGVWHLGNGSTLSTLDSTSNANTGTATSASATPGKINGAIRLSGTGSITETSAVSLSIDRPYTVSLWAYWNSSTEAYNALVELAEAALYNFSLSLKSNGKLAWYVASNSSQASIDGTGTYTLSAGSWYHICALWDGSKLYQYVNGNIDTSAACTFASWTHPTATLYIGKSKYGTGRYWNGSMDEVRIANAARSSQWVATEYNNQSIPTTFISLGSEVSNSVVTGGGVWILRRSLVGNKIIGSGVIRGYL